MPPISRRASFPRGSRGIAVGSGFNRGAPARALPDILKTDRADFLFRENARYLMSIRQSLAGALTQLLDERALPLL